MQLYKQNPLEKFFIFTIYQNYTLVGYNDQKCKLYIGFNNQRCKIFVNI